MNRDLLIAYSYYFGGNYNLILKAIKENQKVAMIKVDNAITILDKEYPKELLNLEFPPFVLYYKGDLKLLECNHKIAIVGSRKPGMYALKATKALAMNKKDSVIISGLAKGIDACAHENAKRSIGILGCGIDYIYPYCNKPLFLKLINEGLILSEYPKDVKPLSYHFPFRNRIICALANSLYVMESKINSGTMKSVNEALKLGIDIKVLPYDVFNKDGINNNNLIYEGAEIILHNEIAF